LLGLFGLSNETVLTYAAALAGGVFIVGIASRALHNLTKNRGLTNRVDRLELRLASKDDFQPILKMAATLLNEVTPQSVEPVTEMFEAANSKRSWFGKRTEPSDIAQRVVDELKENVETTAEIARPIQSLFENGAIEIRAERNRIVQDVKLLASRLNSTTWDRHSTQLLQGGMPNISVTLMQNFFSQVHGLKSAASGLSKGASIDALRGVLRQSATLLKSAEQSVEELRRLAA
jgi:hypothetical protein